MPMPPRALSYVAAALCGLGATCSLLGAQTSSQLAAWDGLILSPVGALAPVARDPIDAGVPGGAFQVRHGRWKYNDDDVVHDNLGLTISRRFARARTELSLTGAYSLVECPTCSGWRMFSLSVGSTFFRHLSAVDPWHAVRYGAGFTVELGGASYRGDGQASTRSVAASIPLEVTLPFRRASALGLTVLPGLGYGRINGDGGTDGGVLPMLGGALAWNLTRQLSIDVGMQRAFASQSATQLGVVLSWVSRARQAAAP